MSASPAEKPAGLSVFFPAYNDSGTIGSMVIRTVKAASELTPDFEIIVVDDGSADSTAEIADELARTYPQVRAVHHPQNRDYGAALRTGFHSATKELIFYTDGDAQYDPAEIALLWPKMTRDVDCDFRLMRREIFDRINLEKTSGIICVEMMKKIQDAGFRIVEVPVHHFHRAFGKSEFFNYRRLIRTARDLTLLWFQLVVRREHMRAGVTPLTRTPADPANRIYPSPPRP